MLEKLVTQFLRGLQLGADGLVFLRVLIFKTQILQLGLDREEPETVGKGSI